MYLQFNVAEGIKIMKYKNNFLKQCFLFLTVGIMVIVTGCTSINYTDEQVDVIADYAANLVLRHDENYGKNYVIPTEEPTTVEQIPTFAQEETYDSNSQSSNGDNSSSDNQLMASDGSISISSSEDLTKALGLNGLNAQYVDYYVTKEYPFENQSDALFVMKSVENNNLLVVKISVSNNTANDLGMNMLEGNRKYRGIVNDFKKYNAQLTLLLDALNTYEGTIKAGEKKEFVLVFQTQLDSKDDVSTLVVDITDGQGNTSTIRLK